MGSAHTGPDGTGMAAHIRHPQTERTPEMGMFKDIKKLSDQGKDMQRAQGKRTGMLGMLRDMPDQLHNATEAVDDAMAMQADMAKQQGLLTSGTPGKATIKSFTDTGTLVNFNPQVVLDLSVAVKGKAPY